MPSLVKLAAARDLSMAGLARESGVSYSMIKYVLAGQSQFSDRTAHKIAMVLGCPVEAFSVPKQPKQPKANGAAA